MLRPASRAASASASGAVPPGTTGTPAARIASRERILSPIASIASGCGPIHAKSAAITARAKAAFSARKPYPGWTASAPARRATSSSLSRLRYDLRRRRGSQEVGFVGQADVQRVAVASPIDRDRRNPHLARGAHDANRDLAAIGDEQFAREVRHDRSDRMRRRAAPRSGVFSSGPRATRRRDAAERRARRRVSRRPRIAATSSSLAGGVMSMSSAPGTSPSRDNRRRRSGRRP